MLAFSRLGTFSLLAGSLSLLAACASNAGDDAAGGSGGASAIAGTGTGVAPITPFAVPANVYSHGEPSNLEQQLLELTQALRANPAKVGAAMVDLPSVQGAISQYMVDKAKVVGDFSTYSPVPPLAFDPDLLASSRVHSIDMAQNGFQEHDGSKGEHFDQRITSAGYQWSYCAENIFSYADDPVECNAAFAIDWGNPELGHRMALLDLDSAKRDVGISIIEMPASSAVGPQVVTEDFGFPSKDKHRFLVGVAYTDQNGNGAYDPGEGLAGMKIVPDVGDTYAVTSMSGGFAIPMTQNVGAFHVQIQDTTGKALQQADASLATDNVKVDFVVP